MFGPIYQGHHVYKIDRWLGFHFIFRKDLSESDSLWIAISKPFKREGSAITVLGMAHKAGVSYEEYLKEKGIQWQKRKYTSR